MKDYERAAGLISAETLAPHLGVSKARLYLLAKDKIVPSISIGRSIKFDVGQIQRWIESGGKNYPGGWRKEPVE